MKEGEVENPPNSANVETVVEKDELALEKESMNVIYYMLSVRMKRFLRKKSDKEKPAIPEGIEAEPSGNIVETEKEEQLESKKLHEGDVKVKDCFF